MCRYMDHRYRTHYVCFGCIHTAKYEPYVEPRCPTCRKPMIDMGMDFKPPRRANAREWRRLAEEAAKGKRFQGCGC